MRMGGGLGKEEIPVCNIWLKEKKKSNKNKETQPKVCEQMNTSPCKQGEEKFSKGRASCASTIVYVER